MIKFGSQVSYFELVKIIDIFKMERFSNFPIQMMYEGDTTIPTVHFFVYKMHYPLKLTFFNTHMWFINVVFFIFI